MKIAFLLFFLFFAIGAKAQAIQYKDKPLTVCKSDYINVVQYQIGNISLKSKNMDLKTYWNVNDGSKDTSGVWVTKQNYGLQKLLKTTESYTLYLTEKNQMRDTSANVIEIVSETQLFNVMSENGYEFLSKDATIPMSLSQYFINVTKFNFKRKKQ